MLSKGWRTGVWCVGLVLVSGCAKTESPPAGELLCYVGGTMRPVMEELARVYEDETGQKVKIDYSDSGQLLIKIETTGRGDLYVCHDPFLESLMKKGLGREGWTLASLTPMIAVPKGNPKNIRGLKDLARPGIKLGLTHEMYSTVGHINPVMFDKAGLRKQIEGNVTTRTRSGGAVANAVGLGHLDAAIVWNAVIHARRDKLDAVDIAPAHRPDPKVDAVTTATFGRIDMSYIRVTMATLKCSKQPEPAEAFAAFVRSPRNRPVFAKYGFSPLRAADREQAPAQGTLTLYCGAGIRPPVAEVVEAFTADTGVTVRCDYAGSGVLLTRLRARPQGDLYMPGDVHYVDLAAKHNLVRSKHGVCYFVPVILVRKGNPKNIRTLKDLTRAGVRLGLGRPEACAIGRLVEKIFDKNRIDRDAVQKNLVFSSLTVNELGLQVKAGKLDATIVWDAVAAYYPDAAEPVAIPASQNIISRVAIGVLRSAKDTDLAERFVAFLTGPRARAIFRKHHYTIDPPK